MPFDGVNYLWAPLIPPIHHHPETPAVGDVCHDALAGSYFVLRKHAQYMGSTTYRQFLRNRFASGTLPGQFVAASFVDLGRVHATIPAHATHIGAVAFFRAIQGGGPSVMYYRVEASALTSGLPSGTADTGDTFTKELAPFGDTATVPLSGRHAAGSRLSTFVPYFYEVQRAEAFVELSNVAPDGNAPIFAKIEGYALNEDGTASTVKPEFATFWWWTEG